MFILKQNDVSDYLDIDIKDFVITNILNKYNIKISSSFLYNLNDDYDSLTNYISDLYIKNEVIPEDISIELVQNINYKKYLLSNIKDRMNNILIDNTTIIFKEIITIVNLLSMGRTFNIFESYDFYNMEQLGLLFREYEIKLQELNETDEENFNLTFELYVILIEVINELCMINSTDILRKKSINKIIEIISETINIIKFNVKLNLKKINTLNNILGKLLFYYSHIPYIDSSNKDSQYLIDEFRFNFEKVCEGYNLSKNTNFANEENALEYYSIFLNSSTTLLLTLFYKLESRYPLDEYNKLEKFADIITLYNNIIEHKSIEVFNSLESFRKNILENYIYIYNKDSSNKDINVVIDKFLENPKLNSLNMHILYSLILFSACYVDEKKLLNILNILIKSEKFRNDFHEFYKLNICDVIINVFTCSKSNLLSNEVIDEITDYVEKNKIASHLMSIYSKIYLSLSLYYSYKKEPIFIEKSSLFYFNYISINGKDLLENEYSKLNREILLNHGKIAIEKMNLESILISDSKYVEIGKKLLEQYFEKQEINLKFSINQNLSNIVTEIFTTEGLNNELLNSHISQFISKNIFHGLAFVYVKGLTKEEEQLDDLGYEVIKLQLVEEYTLIIAYSKVYKYIFENIYSYNKEFIKQNIVNIIISYIKSIPIYLDYVTGLYNINKLRTELMTKSPEDELIFIEIYIENMFILNRKYHYKKTNSLFKTYTEKINNLVKTYRLYGPKIGILLDKKDDYNKILEKINEFNFEIEDEKIKPSLVISVSWGNMDNILEKSSHSLDLAFSKEDKYNEFK